MLVIDDVTTSGSTLNEVLRTLAYFQSKAEKEQTASFRNVFRSRPGLTATPPLQGVGSVVTTIPPFHLRDGGIGF